MDKSDVLFQRSDHSNSSHNNQNLVLLKLEFLTILVLEDITIKEEEENLLAEVCSCNFSGQQKKLVVKAVKKLYCSSTKSVCSVEQFKNNDLLLFCSKIYIPNVLDLLLELQKVDFVYFIFSIFILFLIYFLFWNLGLEFNVISQVTIIKCHIMMLSQSHHHIIT